MEIFASRGFRSPRTMAREARRGCFLSYFKSARLSKASAALLAPAMATVIQTSSITGGIPPAAKKALM